MKNDLRRNVNEISINPSLWIKIIRGSYYKSTEKTERYLFIRSETFHLRCPSQGCFHIILGRHWPMVYKQLMTSFFFQICHFYSDGGFSLFLRSIVENEFKWIYNIIINFSYIIDWIQSHYIVDILQFFGKTNYDNIEMQINSNTIQLIKVEIDKFTHRIYFIIIYIYNVKYKLYICKLKRKFV